MEPIVQSTVELTRKLSDEVYRTVYWGKTGALWATRRLFLLLAALLVVLLIVERGTVVYTVIMGVLVAILVYAFFRPLPWMSKRFYQNARPEKGPTTTTFYDDKFVVSRADSEAEFSYADLTEIRQSPRCIVLLAKNTVAFVERNSMELGGPEELFNLLREKRGDLFKA